MRRIHITYKLLIILFLTVSTLFMVTKDSNAETPQLIGFIIDAEQMEGSITGLAMTTGETPYAKDVPMLEMKFDSAAVLGLTIKKLVQSPKGLITTNITSKDTVLFKNLTLKVTNAQFGQYYLPKKGNIGLKKVKLLAHDVSAVDSNLPLFHMDFQSGGEIELQPKSEQELIQLKGSLEQLLSSIQKSDAE
ncbi:hypothetical protein [Neobacillus sp. LXY-1]|uniref:hypothetical protein n=1 Tax=Neobacillus sp. LXY-1 TaxID=3379133 RepID=UPI003EDFF06C